MLKARHEHIEGIHSTLRISGRTGYLGHRHLRQALHTVPQGAKALPEAGQSHLAGLKVVSLSESDSRAPMRPGKASGRRRGSIASAFSSESLAGKFMLCVSNPSTLALGLLCWWWW